jgi:hypothetical protein
VAKMSGINTNLTLGNAVTVRSLMVLSFCQLHTTSKRLQAKKVQCASMKTPRRLALSTSAKREFQAP